MCRRGIKNGIPAYNDPVPIPMKSQMVEWKHLRGVNSCDRETHLWAQHLNHNDSAPSVQTASTSKGSLILPPFLVWMQILTLESLKFIQQPGNQILLWKISQQETLLGCISSAWYFQLCQRTSLKKASYKQFCPQLFRHSQRCLAALIMTHVPSQAYLPLPGMTSNMFFKQNNKTSN